MGMKIYILCLVFSFSSTVFPPSLYFYRFLGYQLRNTEQEHHGNNIIPVVHVENIPLSLILCSLSAVTQ